VSSRLIYLNESKAIGRQAQRFKECAIFVRISF
jgi:hypothetical protein